MRNRELVFPIIVGTVAWFLGKKVGAQKCAVTCAPQQYLCLALLATTYVAAAGYRVLHAQVDAVRARPTRRGSVSFLEEGQPVNRRLYCSAVVLHINTA